MEEEQVNPAPDQEPDKEEVSSMNRFLLPLFVVLLLVIGAGAFFIGAQRRTQPSPSPTISATPTVEPSPTGSPTATPKATKTPTPTKVPTSTQTPSPTSTKKPTPTPTKKITPSTAEIELLSNEAKNSKNEQEEKPTPQVLGESTSKLPFLFIGLGIIFLSVCAILAYFQLGDKILPWKRKQSL